MFVKPEVMRLAERGAAQMPLAEDGGPVFSLFKDLGEGDLGGGKAFPPAAGFIGNAG